MEAEGNDPPRARHALGQIGGLYAVEEKIRMEHLEGEMCIRDRVNSVNFPLKPKEGEYSGPYECKIAAEMNFIVAAYRYINRLEIYKLSDQKFQLNTIIGDANNQYDLYRLNKDKMCIRDRHCLSGCTPVPHYPSICNLRLPQSLFSYPFMFQSLNF